MDLFEIPGSDKDREITIYCDYCNDEVETLTIGELEEMTKEPWKTIDFLLLGDPKRSNACSECCQFLTETSWN